MNIKTNKLILFLVVSSLLCNAYLLQQTVLINQSLDEAYYKIQMLKNRLDGVPVSYNK